MLTSAEMAEELSSSVVDDCGRILTERLEGLSSQEKIEVLGNMALMLVVVTALTQMNLPSGSAEKLARIVREGLEHTGIRLHLLEDTLQ